MREREGGRQAGKEGGKVRRGGEGASDTPASGAERSGEQRPPGAGMAGKGRAEDGSGVRGPAGLPCRGAIAPGREFRPGWGVVVVVGNVCASYPAPQPPAREWLQLGISDERLQAGQREALPPPGRGWGTPGGSGATALEPSAHPSPLFPSLSLSAEPAC